MILVYIEYIESVWLVFILCNFDHNDVFSCWCCFWNHKHDQSFVLVIIGEHLESRYILDSKEHYISYSLVIICNILSRKIWWVTWVDKSPYISIFRCINIKQILMDTYFLSFFGIKKLTNVFPYETTTWDILPRS